MAFKLFKSGWGCIPLLLQAAYGNLTHMICVDNKQVLTKPHEQNLILLRPSAKCAEHVYAF